MKIQIALDAIPEADRRAFEAVSAIEDREQRIESGVRLFYRLQRIAEDRDTRVSLESFLSKVSDWYEKRARALIARLSMLTSASIPRWVILPRLSLRRNGVLTSYCPTMAN